MADKSGQADIRGLDIDKLAKGFADQEFILKQYCTVTPTSAREIRWYQKTAGTLDSTDTTAITASQIANTDFGALPVVVEQSWTRQTSYVRKYFVESPLLTDEDIKDSDIDILATNIRDLVRAVANQIDIRIYNVISENLSPSTINTSGARGTGWDDTTNGNPIYDIQYAKEQIKANNYDTSSLIMYINQAEETLLLDWLITTKGSSIPSFSSEKVGSGVVMQIMGVRVVVSPNATTDYALFFVPGRTCTWKTFKELSSVTIPDPMIGTKIRVGEEGEALLTDPSSAYLLTDVKT
jgi:hypothetical protein